MTMLMADEPHFPSVADDFATLATPHESGDRLTEEEYAAGERTVRRYWPKGDQPRPLPEKYR
jgi:hypothetical protein